MQEKQIPNRRLRSFGLIVASGFAVVGVAPAILRAQDPRIWALTFMTVLASTALIFPPALRPFHRIWMTMGEMLGWLNTRIILTLTYYLLIVPIGATLRLIGNDPMRRNYDKHAETYRIACSKRPASHMYHQY
jgi:hypothetical protein